MPLFVQSGISAQNVQAGTLGVGQAANSAAGVVSGTANAVTSTVRGVESAVINTAENVVSGAISGVATLFNSAENAVANAVSSTFGSLFGNTNSSGLGTVNTVIPDPVASSFKGGTPKSTLFSTNPVFSQLDAVSFPGQVSSNTYGLSPSIQGSYASLAQRYGQSTSYLTGNINSVVAGSIQTSGLSGLYTDLSAVQAVGVAVGTVVGTVAAVSADYQALAGGVSLGLTGSSTGLNSYYNSSLPTTATIGGMTINGIPSGTSSSTLSSLTSAMGALGCSANSTLNAAATAYGAVQSLLGGLIELASQLNLNTILADLLGCSQYGTYGQSVASSMFYATAGNNAGTAYTLSGGLSPSMVAITPQLTSSILTNPNLTPSDAGSVNGIFSNLNVPTQSLLGTGQTIGGQPVWNSALTSQTPAWLVNSLAPGQNLASLQNGASVPIVDFGTAT